MATSLPRADIGDSVLWRPHPNDASRCLGIVIGAGDSTLDLMLFPKDSLRGVPKHGVRHKDDPSRVSYDMERVTNEAGVWEQTAAARRLEALAARLDRLEADLLGSE